MESYALLENEVNVIGNTDESIGVNVAGWIVSFAQQVGQRIRGWSHSWCNGWGWGASPNDGGDWGASPYDCGDWS